MRVLGDGSRADDVEQSGIGVDDRSTASSPFLRIAADAVTTLKRRAGFVDDPATARLRRSLSSASRYAFGLNVGSFGHRENFAGVRVHDDGAAADGAVLDDAGVQLALGDVLQVLVDRQLDGRSGGRRPFEPAEGADGARRSESRIVPVLPRICGVVGGLESAEAGVVETDQPSRWAPSSLLG